MIIQQEERVHISSGNALESAEFTTQMNAKSFKILSQSTYSKPVCAVVRELAANAVDAHKEKGLLPSDPIFIHKPTNIEPWYAIKDSGVGMSKEFLLKNYPSYFDSDKTTTNDQIGGLGIGSKTPFILADSFTVTSIHKGIKCICNVYLNKKGTPSIDVIKCTETTEPTGTEITIPVLTHKIAEINAAIITELYWLYKDSKQVFLYANTNTQIDFSEHKFEKFISDSQTAQKTQQYIIEDDDTIIFYKRNMAYWNSNVLDVHYGVLMGGVLYNIDNQEAINKIKRDTNITDDVGVIFKCSIGEIKEFHPSRERIGLHKVEIYDPIQQKVIVSEDPQSLCINKLSNSLKKIRKEKLNNLMHCLDSFRRRSSPLLKAEGLNNILSELSTLVSKESSIAGIATNKTGIAQLFEKKDAEEIWKKIEAIILFAFLHQKKYLDVAAGMDTIKKIFFDTGTLSPHFSITEEAKKQLTLLNKLGIHSFYWQLTKGKNRGRLIRSSSENYPVHFSSLNGRYTFNVDLCNEPNIIRRIYEIYNREFTTLRSRNYDLFLSTSTFLEEKGIARIGKVIREYCICQNLTDRQIIIVEKEHLNELQDFLKTVFDVDVNTLVDGDFENDIYNKFEYALVNKPSGGKKTFSEAKLDFSLFRGFKDSTKITEFWKEKTTRTLSDIENDPNTQYLYLVLNNRSPDKKYYNNAKDGVIVNELQDPIKFSLYRRSGYPCYHYDDSLNLVHAHGKLALLFSLCLPYAEKKTEKSVQIIGIHRDDVKKVAKCSNVESLLEFVRYNLVTMSRDNKFWNSVISMLAIEKYRAQSNRIRSLSKYVNSLDENYLSFCVSKEERKLLEKIKKDTLDYFSDGVEAMLTFSNHKDSYLLKVCKELRYKKHKHIYNTGRNINRAIAKIAVEVEDVVKIHSGKIREDQLLPMINNKTKKLFGAVEKLIEKNPLIVAESIPSTLNTCFDDMLITLSVIQRSLGEEKAKALFTQLKNKHARTEKDKP